MFEATYTQSDCEISITADENRIVISGEKDSSKFLMVVSAEEAVNIASALLLARETLVRAQERRQFNSTMSRVLRGEKP